MLKQKLSETAWGKLTPAVQELYTEVDGEHVLQVESDGRDEVGPLKRALERVKADLQAERDARKEVEGKLDDLDVNDARKRGDIDKLTSQWEKKLDEAETAKADEISKLQTYIKQTTLDSVVSSITTRYTGSKENAELLDPHIRSKLAVEFGNGEPQVVVNTQNGPQPFDAESFEKSVVDNPAYKAIIITNRASGGDAADGHNSGQGGGAFQTDNQGQSGGAPDLSAIDPAKLAGMLPVPKP